VHTKQSFVTQITEGFSQKAKIAMPEELVGTDGEVGVEKNLQSGSFG
jgi:hypothetical protein